MQLEVQINITNLFSKVQHGFLVSKRLTKHIKLKQKSHPYCLSSLTHRMYTGWLLTSAVNLTCRTCTQTWLSFTSDHAERTIVLISVDSSITFISNAGTAHTLVCDSYYNNFNSSPSRHTLIINRVSLAASILSFIVFIIAFVYAYSFSTSFVLSASSLTCF